MKIYAPVKDANGIYASVRFVNGVGETNNPALIEWFRKHGYRVENVADETTEKCAIIADIPLEKCATNEQPDFEAMTSDELRAWAKENGMGGVIKNTRNKEKLLELLRG